MQHQPHEPFFSFTVPPKPTYTGIHPYPSPAPSQHNLLTSVVADLDHTSRSPSFASPTLNRPNTAGRFAFSVPSAIPAVTPPSTVTRVSSNQHQLATPASSVTTSLDRPYSSSGLPASTTFPQTVTNTQTFASNHAPSPHDVLKSANRSNFPSLDSHSPLLTNPNEPRYVIPSQHTRPMTAPGSGCMGRQDLADESEFTSPHVGLYGPYPPHPADLSRSDISKAAISQAELTNANQLVHSSPGSSSVLAGYGDLNGRAPHGSTSGSSDPDSRRHDSNSGEYSADCSANSSLPQFNVSGSGRPSLGTRSSESTPETPESLDGDHPQPQNFLHSMSPNQYHHLLRPNTHSGTSTSFGEEKFLSQPLQPRPTTGYLHHYEPPSNYSSLQSQCHQYPPRMPVYPPHSSHIYANSPVHYAHVPGPTEPKGHDRLYNFTILPGAPRKRARRRFDEVERLYSCTYPGCTKAYGTLNHLNAHISMQKHGLKRLPQEFKEIRKEWRARRKAESEARNAMKQSPVQVGGVHEYGVFASPEGFRRPHTGINSNSSPGCTRTPEGFGQVTPPAVVGPYSAPAHSQHFTMMDRHQDWHNECRVNNNPATIDEQPEYIGSSSHHHSPPPLLLPNHSSSSPPSTSTYPSSDHHFNPHHHHLIPAPRFEPRPTHLLMINYPPPSMVDQS